jgi:hypothetical protein
MSETRNPAPMTIDAITRDAWAAVNTPIPEAPSDELLKVAREALARCVEESFRDWMSSPFEVRGMDQDYVAARARAAEVDDILRARELSRQPVTIEAIERDPWNAIILELPENGTPQLYEAASIAAEVLLSTPDGELPRMPFPAPTNDLEWSWLYDEIKTRWREAADKAYAAAEALDAQRRQGAAPEVGDAGYSRWTGEPLGAAAGVGQSAGKGQSHR